MKTVSLKKVADLDKVVQLCGALGPNYTPGNEALMPTALASLLLEATEKMKAVNSAHVAAATLSKQRRISFKGIPSLATKIVRRATSMQLTVAQQLLAREIKRKYFHGYAPKPLTTDASTATSGAEPESQSRHTNFRDFEGQLAGLQQLIQLVSTINGYKSVEPEFTLEGLNQTFNELRGLHLATISARMALTEARKARNEMVSGNVSETVRAFKDYLRSKYGFNDPTLQQL